MSQYLDFQAENYFGVMYRRYLKHLVGWKRATELHMNQLHVLELLHQVTINS